MPEIRILQVFGVMNRGGAETMIMNMYRNIERSRVQFDFVVHTDQEAAYDDEIAKLGGRIYHCPHFTGKNIFQYRKWWNDFFSGPGEIYGIVHGHIGSTAAIYLKIASDFGKFTIAHSHNSGTDHSLKQKMYRILSYNTRNIADEFFACSNVAGIDRYGKSIARNKSRYHIFHNAIDTEQFNYNQEKRIEMRKSLGYLQEHIVVGNVGRFAQQKNHHLIIEIFRIAARTNDNLRLLLVGDGPLKAEVENQVERYGITDKVIFLGVRQDVSDLMSAMDLFLFPSLHEGLPVVLVEAQTSGLPCLISDAVPSESILCADLVRVEKLTKQAEDWAKMLDAVIKKCDVRTGHAAEVRKAGYDVVQAARWLEDYYVSKYPK